MTRKDPYSDLPRLEDDVVLFETLTDFKRHFNAFMRHAALLVRSVPLDVGSRRRLTLRVEDLGRTHVVDTTVQYRNKDGLVGLAIEGFSDHRGSLQAMAEDDE